MVAILANGVDTSGKRIPVHNLEAYYQMRKSDVIIVGTPSSVVASSKVPVNATTSATATSIKSIESVDFLDKVRNEPEFADIRDREGSIERLDVIKIHFTTPMPY